MKRVLLTALLAALLSSVVGATDLSVKYTHTIVAADTTAHEWRDTVYTPWVYLPDFGSTLWFSTEITNGGKTADTALATDTFFCILQHAPSNQGAAGLDANRGRTNLTIQTIAFTSADNDTIVNSAIKLDADSTWTGTWGRGMFIYGDTCTNGIVAMGTVRTYYLKLWINGFLK